MGTYHEISNALGYLGISEKVLTFAEGGWHIEAAFGDATCRFRSYEDDPQIIRLAGKYFRGFEAVRAIASALGVVVE